MDLPRRVSEWPFAGAGEEEPSRGQLLAGLGQGGAAARPLDGGVLTRWGARTPARGPATAPCLPAPLPALALGVSLWWSCCAEEKERRVAKRERQKTE